MEVSGVLTLTILAISAVFCAYASPAAKCKTENIGVSSRFLRKLNIRIPLVRSIWDFHVPRVCKNDPVVGLRVSACDFDAPPFPTLQILALDWVRLKRNATPHKWGALLITVYCQQPWTTLSQHLPNNYESKDLDDCHPGK